MKGLEDHIAQLLRRHDCVIVPNFGGFVANYKSAIIDEFRKKIHPPSKTILFNSQLTNNDGLLGNHMARELPLSYSKALDYIKDRADYWIQKFGNGERIEIGEIGFLYRENGRIHFEQSREVNLLMQAYGLESIDFVNFTETLAAVKRTTVAKAAIEIEENSNSAKATKFIQEETTPDLLESGQIEKPLIALSHDEQIVSVDDGVRSELRNLPPIRRNLGVVTLRYVAAAAVVPILFYSYWIAMETDALETKSIQFSDFNPIHPQVEKYYSKRERDTAFEELETPQSWDQLTENINAKVYNYELTEDFYVPILLSDVETDVVISDSNDSEASVVSAYHVISGCFSIKSNAEKLVSNLKKEGFSASILDVSGGLHRVSVGGYSSRNDAKASLERLRSTGKSGWILKK